MAGRIVYEQIVRESEKQAVVQVLFGAGISEFIEGEYQHSADGWIPVEDSSFDPLIVIACVMAAPSVARQLQSLLRDVKEPEGMLIDLRGGKVRRCRLPSLDRGTLVIVTEEREAVYRPAENDAAVAALKAVLSRLEN
jgi:hypothetical protein